MFFIRGSPSTRNTRLSPQHQVRTEREGVGRETENANIEADKVAIIQNEVSRKQADAESDLAKAEPAVLAAMSALDTLDKSQLGQCKTMSVPPPGVVDIFIACMVSGTGGYIHRRPYVFRSHNFDNLLFGEYCPRWRGSFFPSRRFADTSVNTLCNVKIKTCIRSSNCRSFCWRPSATTWSSASKPVRSETRIAPGTA